MSLSNSCGRCAAFCRDRNPVVARLLGVCPLVAVSDSVLKGVVFGAFFVTVLWLTVIVAAVLGSLVVRPLRPLFLQASSAAIVGVMASLVMAKWFDFGAMFGVYLAVVAVNCLVLDEAADFAARQHFGAAIRSTLISGGLIVSSLTLFAAVRELAAYGTLLHDTHRLDPALEASAWIAGPLPIFAAPAGALILMGLGIAALNAASLGAADGQPAPQQPNAADSIA